MQKVEQRSVDSISKVLRDNLDQDVVSRTDGLACLCVPEDQKPQPSAGDRRH